MQRDGATAWHLASAQAKAFALAALVAIAVFALLLAAAGKDPLRAYADTLVYVFGNAYGFCELLVRMTPLVFTAAAPVALTVWWLLYRTRWGLALRTTGEARPWRLRQACARSGCAIQALVLAGLLGGIAGAHISVALTLTWAEGMTAGRGFIAIALVIFAKWDPLWAIAGALLFGGAEGLQLQLQAAGAEVSPFIMNMLPYLLTLLVLVVWGWSRRTAAPAALGRSFVGVE
jgi:general nucleoside transport system permease protein